MDEQQEKLQLQRLAVERQKLNEVQRELLDRFCQVLKANEIYKTDAALAAAELIRTKEGRRLQSDLQDLARRTDQQALIDQRKAFAEADKQKEIQTEAQRKEQENRLAEQKEVQARELAAQEAARNEPIPGSVQQFEAVLEQSIMQRAQLEVEHAREQQLVETAKNLKQDDDLAAGAWVAHAETLDRQRYQFGAYDELRSFTPNDAGGQLPEDLTSNDSGPDKNPSPVGVALQDDALNAGETHQPLTEVFPQPVGPEAAPPADILEPVIALPTFETELAAEPVASQTQEQAITVPAQATLQHDPVPMQSAAQDQETGLLAELFATGTPERAVAAHAQDEYHEVETRSLAPTVAEQETGLTADFVTAETREEFNPEHAPQHQQEQSHGVEPQHAHAGEAEVETGLMADFVTPAAQEQAVAVPVHDQQLEVKSEAASPTAPEQESGLIADFVTPGTKEEVASERAMQNLQEQPRTIEPSLIQAGEAQVETGLIADFVSTETKEQVAAERAQKEIERQWQEAGPSLTM